MTARSELHKVGGRELEEVRESDPDGRIVVHHRTVDTLGKMLRAGTITQEMHDAARSFQSNFAIASLDPIRAAPMLRVPGAGREPDLNERQLDARRRVHLALQALGGIEQPGRLMRVARHRLWLFDQTVGNSPWLERSPGAAGAGDGDPDRGVGRAGSSHARRICAEVTT